MSAQATNFMNYASISGISRSTANSYIEAVTEEKGGSYVFGYDLGLSFQSILDGKAVKTAVDAGKASKTTKAVSRVYDA